jgi:hypothetical protein
VRSSTRTLILMLLTPGLPGDALHLASTQVRIRPLR